MDGCLKVLLAPMVVFMAAPAVAFLPGALFIMASVGGLRVRGPRRGAAVLGLLAGLAWVAYGIYELRMHAWSKTVTAPIRLDLGCIAPVLLGLSTVGAFALIWTAKEWSASSDSGAA